MAAQLQTGQLFTKESFLAALSWGKREGAVKDEMYLALPERWLQICLEALAPGKFVAWQVGTDVGWFDGAKWYRGPKAPAYGFLTMRWDRPSGGNHWTYYDPYLSIAWDPYAPTLRPLIPSGHHRYLIVEA